MDLVEDNRKITPRDYLELALRPVQGSGRDIAAKNEVSFFFLFWFFKDGSNVNTLIIKYQSIRLIHLIMILR